MLTQPAAPWHYFKLQLVLEWRAAQSMCSSGTKSSVLFMGMNERQVCSMFWGVYIVGEQLLETYLFSLRVLKRHLQNYELQSIEWTRLLPLKMGECVFQLRFCRQGLDFQARRRVD